MMAPIPGMSLTRTPKNQPWEQPPMYAKKEEALAFYLERLNDPEVLDDALFTLKHGFPVEAFVDSMTSYGVMEGYHTIDVKTLISPVLHEHLMTLGDALKLKFTEWAGETDDERKSAKDKQRMQFLIEEALDDPTPVEEMEEGAVKDASEALQGDKEPLIKKRSQNG